MPAELVVWTDGGTVRRPLTRSRVSIGRADGNDVVLPDPSVSALHAVLERYPGGWTIRDLASTNGTWVSGRRIWVEHRLRHGESLRFGGIEARFDGDDSTTTTSPQEEPPHLTPRERAVLIELCRPLVSGGLFTSPAGVGAISKALFISPGAVKQHLAKLQRKFEVPPGVDRRAALANAAFRRGAIQHEDLVDHP